MVVTTATALAAASLVVGAVGTVAQGQAASNQAKFQSEVQRQQAERERQIASANESDFRRKESAVLAHRRALMGASGVEAGTGSPLLTSEDFAAETELNALRIRAGGETNATRLEQSAQMSGLAGRNARTGGYFRAGSLLLQGAGSLYPKPLGTTTG